MGIYFPIIFWVLRTLRYQWQSCGQLRKYGRRAPGKGLCPLHSRQPFKKGWTLNLFCRTPFPRDRAQQSGRFGPAERENRAAPDSYAPNLPGVHRQNRRLRAPRAVSRIWGGHLTPRRAAGPGPARVLVHWGETWRVQARSLVAAIRAAKPTSHATQTKTDSLFRMGEG